MLHINPGAAGMSGFHKGTDFGTFCYQPEGFRDLEVIELADK